MGEVFLAHDLELDRKIALKLLRGQLGVSGAHARLRTEALALARLSHPHVVQVYGFGEHDGRAHVAMEYVAGPTLATWLRDAGPGWREILTKFRDAARHPWAWLLSRVFAVDVMTCPRCRGAMRLVKFGPVRRCASPANEHAVRAVSRSSRSPHTLDPASDVLSASRSRSATVCSGWIGRNKILRMFGAD